MQRKIFPVALALLKASTSASMQVDSKARINRAIKSLLERLFPVRWQLVSVATTLSVALQSRAARADSIFSNAQKAMECIITNASAGGAISNAVLTSLPMILFTALTIVLFGYFCFSVYQGVAAYGRGEEVSNVIQQPIFTFISVILIVVFQSLLFGNNAACS
ncbi:hypothetical protein NIES37_68730 [Tolypothrix tenuis PCC 7101]|uniref:Uncharacterized protein n=1 Tax=Tolypothrix tenuis PCC 7101 TaxID=231146 RepID=A0A1Z4NAY1_9CYAN|nr:hypothetical protein [Aulosira sp. FACHB-113]BAZ02860.1 hypothetical protein NIES37_68730 [Tolypothrix tenuis PCC 7101]BAZ78246.1 hypothetical protein NIES50_68790 [Aulosira laxa NIES-50]